MAQFLQCFVQPDGILNEVSAILKNSHLASLIQSVKILRSKQFISSMLGTEFVIYMMAFSFCFSPVTLWFSKIKKIWLVIVDTCQVKNLTQSETVLKQWKLCLCNSHEAILYIHKFIFYIKYPFFIITSLNMNISQFRMFLQ